MLYITKVTRDAEKMGAAWHQHIRETGSRGLFAFFAIGFFAFALIFFGNASAQEWILSATAKINGIYDAIYNALFGWL